MQPHASPIQLTHGSLFSGIGGFDLAAQLAGIRNVWHCEKDPFCQRILATRFPESRLYPDVRGVAELSPEKVDIISGGFPCQPFSTSGKRRGQADDRFLWPAMLQVIRYVQPRWVVGENVVGILNLGVSKMLAELEVLGYEVWPVVIPAAATGKHHLRRRVWFLAHADGQGLRLPGALPRLDFAALGKGVTDDADLPLSAQWLELARNGEPLRTADGFPSRLDRSRISALGNAVVPAIPHAIFTGIRLIEEHIARQAA